MLSDNQSCLGLNTREGYTPHMLGIFLIVGTLMVRAVKGKDM